LRGFAQKLIKFDERHCVSESIEVAVVGQTLGRLRKSTPGGTSKRSADADTPNTERGEILHRQIGWTAGQHINWSRRDGRNNRDNLLARRDAGCVETISAGRSISSEPTRCFVDVRSPNQKAFGSPNQHCVTTSLIDRHSRCLYSRDSVIKFIKLIRR